MLSKSGSFPFTYLGLPIGGQISRLKAWDPIIERIEKKLDLWKGRLLSIGGRVTLIKSSDLLQISTLLLSLFPIHKGIIDKINKIQRQFLWSGSMDKKNSLWWHAHCGIT